MAKSVLVLYYLWAIQPFDWWTAWIFIITRTWLHNGWWRRTIRTWTWTFWTWTMTWATATATARAITCWRWRFGLWHHINWHWLTLCISSWWSTPIDSRCTPISPSHYAFCWFCVFIIFVCSIALRSSLFSDVFCRFFRTTNLPGGFFVKYTQRPIIFQRFAQLL